MPILTCKEAQSNKFWSYEIINDTTVEVAWGRIGLDGQKKTHTFGSKWERDAFVADKIREKNKKGYKESNEQQLQTEKEVAQELGHQYKVSRTEFVRRNGDQLSIVSSYDPTQHIYVEVLNSWSKEIHRFLLSTKESMELEGVTEANRVIEFDSIRASSGQLVRGVRSYLKRLAQKIVEVVKAKFGASLGVRKLALGVEEDEELIPGSAESTEIYDLVAEPMASRQTVMKFAALGARKLDL